MPPDGIVSLRRTHLRSAGLFGAPFALFTVVNMANSAQAGPPPPWWQWVALPTVSFILFGGLAYGVLRSSGKAAPVDGQIAVSGGFAAAFIGVFVLAIVVPVVLWSTFDGVSGSAVLFWTFGFIGLWVALVAAFDAWRLRRHQ